MSREIDERIVSMQFNNQNFEKNVSTTMGSLDKLDKKLKLKGASKGLEDVGKASEKVSKNVTGLGGVAETVSLKFSALQVVGLTALTRIANQAVATGERMLKALTIDPITTGLKEYETQIGAVQTILANTSSKGTSLDQVNAALDELNRYADKTIYNFTEMTRNIGTFTAAGVDLDTSVSAIQGIANLAAVSGSTSQQASSAMYQLSQALAAGRVNLMDWNSVVNAGMGGEVFQNALKNTAKAMGTDVDAIIAKYGSFRESLTNGEWLTTDVLTKTLEQFTMAAEEGSKEWEEFKKSLMDDGYTAAQAEEILKMANTATDAATKVKTLTQLWDVMKEAAQSGWAQTWELIMGDFEEAKALWTPLSEFLTGIINDSSERRNALLSGALDSNWSKLIDRLGEAGYTADDLKKKMLEAAGNPDLIESVIEKHGSLEKAVRSGAISSDLLSRAVAGLNTELVDLSKIESDLNFGSTGEDVKQMQEALKKLGYDIGSSGIDGIFGSATEQAIKNFQEAQGLAVTGVLDSGTLEALKESTSATNEATTELIESTKGLIDAIKDKGGRELLIESFTNIGKAIMAFIKPIKEAFREIFPPATSEQVLSLIERFKKFTETLKISDETAAKIKNTFKGVFAVIKIIIDVVKNIAGGFIRLVGSCGGVVDGLLRISSAIGEAITGFQQSIQESGMLTKVIDALVLVFNKAANAVSNFLSSGFGALGPIFKGLWQIIQSVSSKISNAIGNMFGGLFDALQGGDLKKIMDVVNSGIFATVLLSVKKFVASFTEQESILDKLMGILTGFTDKVGGVLDSVRGSLNAWQQQLKAGTLLKLAGAIAVLAIAVSIIASIDRESLMNALGGITIMIAELAGAVAVLQKTSLSGTGGIFVTLLGLAISLTIMAGALKKLSGLNAEQLENGVLAIAGLLGSLVVAMKALSIGSGRMMKGVSGVIMITFAVKILASVVKDLGAEQWDTIENGLLSVGALLAMIDIFLNTAKFRGGAISSAIGIVILTAAISILADVVKELGVVKVSELEKGLTAIGILLAEIAVFSQVSKKSMASAITLLALAGVMHVLVGVMQELGKLTWEQVGIGLLAIGGSLLTLAYVVRMLPKKDLIMAGLFLGGITGALEVLADVMAKFAKIPIDKMIAGIGAMAVMLIMLLAALKGMDDLEDEALALIVAGAALWILGAALSYIGGIGIIGVVSGLVSMALAFTTIGLAAKLLKPYIGTIFKLSMSIISLGASFTALGIGMFAIGTGMATIITSLVASIMMLQGLSWKDIATGVLTLAAVFAVIGISAALLKPFIGTILSVSWAITLLSVSCMMVAMAISIMAAGLSTLALAGEEGASTIVNSLTTIITGLVEMLPSIIKSLIDSAEVLIVEFCDAIVTCVPAIANAVLQITVGVLEALSQNAPIIIDFLIDFIVGILDRLTARLPELMGSIFNFVKTIIDQLAKAFKSINPDMFWDLLETVGTIAAIMVVANLLKSLAPGAMLGILGIAAVVAELGILIAAFGALAQIPGLQWLIEEGGDFLQSIGTAIGQFIGGIVGGLAEGFTSSLPDIGTNLSNFMTNLTPFIDGVALIPDNIGGKMAALSGAIIALTAADLLNAIASFLTGGASFAQLGTDLSAFMTNAEGFISSASSLNEGMLGGVKALAGAILVLTAAEVMDGLASWITGGSSLADFGAQLPQLGTDLAGFTTNLGTFSTDQVTTVECAAGALVALAHASNEIPNDGGVWGWLAGENSLAAFSENLPGLGTNLAAFVTNLGTFSSDQQATVDCAANAIKSIATASGEIPNDGGVWGWLAGENSLAAFSENLPGLGTNLAAFVANLGTFSEDQVMTVDCAGRAIAALATAADEIPNEGGVWGWLAGDSSLSEFGDNLADLGEDLAAFVTNLGTFNEDQVATVGCAVDAINALATLSDADLDDASDDMWIWGDTLDDLALQISGFVESMHGIANFSASIKKFEMLVAATKELSNKDGEVVLSFSDSLAQLGTNGVTSFIDAFDGVEDKVINAGETLVENFIDGTENKSEDAKTSITTISNNAALALLDTYKNFYNAGAYVVTGFCAGIDDNATDAYDSGYALGIQAKTGAEDALDENSPSKEFRKIGDFAGMPFVKALESYVGDSYDAGYDIGDSAKSGLKDTLSRISDFMGSGVDYNPTISPVLNLSNVRAGVKAIGGMLDMGASVGVMANLSAINSTMNHRSQNGANDDVIRAIDRLGTGISNQTGDTYNINGMSYSNNAELEDALKVIMRYMTVEGRV